MKDIYVSLCAAATLLMGCTQDPAPLKQANRCEALPRFERTALIASDCAKLTAQLWSADKPRGGIVMLHNFGDYHAAFEQIAPKFQEARYTTLAYDQRGFGHSGENGRWYGQAALVNDAMDAVSVLRGLLGDGLPVYILGESMGGSIGLVLASQNSSLDGLILVGPGVRDGIDFRWAWDAALWAGGTFAPSYTVSNPRGDNAALTQTAQQRLAHSDLIVTQVRLDTYSGLIDLTDAASAAAADVRVPTLLLYGENDDTVAPVAIKNARQDLGQVTYEVYPGAPHLVLQSSAQDDAIEKILIWLAAQTN